MIRSTHHDRNRDPGILSLPKGFSTNAQLHFTYALALSEIVSRDLGYCC